MEKLLKNQKVPIEGLIYDEHYVIDIRRLCVGDEEFIVEALSGKGLETVLKNLLKYT